MIFNQFTPDMLDFLAENHLRNSKSWYDEHKDVYKKLVTEPEEKALSTDLITPQAAK